MSKYYETDNRTRRIYNRFESKNAMGLQKYGNRIFVEELTESGDYHYWAAISPRYFVPCLTQYESETKSSIGRLGANVDTSNTEKVNGLVAELQEKYDL